MFVLRSSWLGTGKGGKGRCRAQDSGLMSQAHPRVSLPSKSCLCGRDSASPDPRPVPLCPAPPRQQNRKVCSPGRDADLTLPELPAGGDFSGLGCLADWRSRTKMNFLMNFAPLRKKNYSEQELYVDWRRSKFRNPRAPRFVNFEPRSSESALCILIIARDRGGWRAGLVFSCLCVAFFVERTAGGYWRRGGPVTRLFSPQNDTRWKISRTDTYGGVQNIFPLEHSSSSIQQTN